MRLFDLLTLKHSTYKPKAMIPYIIYFLFVMLLKCTFFLTTFPDLVVAFSIDVFIIIFASIVVTIAILIFWDKIKVSVLFFLLSFSTFLCLTQLEAVFCCGKEIINFSSTKILFLSEREYFACLELQKRWKYFFILLIQVSTNIFWGNVWASCLCAAS